MEMPWEVCLLPVVSSLTESRYTNDFFYALGHILCHWNMQKCKIQRSNPKSELNVSKQIVVSSIFKIVSTLEVPSSKTTTPTLVN